MWGCMFIALKPLAQRPGRVSAADVVNRLRRKFTSVPGATLFLQANQDIQVGGRSSDAQYQYTLSDENLNELNTWAPQLLARMPGPCPSCATSTPTSRTRAWPPIWSLIATALRGWASPPAAIDQMLYDAFGQRQVSTMYTALNQYYVVMEVDPIYQLSPDALNGIYIKASKTSGATTAMPSTTTATTTAATTVQSTAAPWCRWPPSRTSRPSAPR